MKRITLVLLCLALIMGIAACGTTTNEPPPANTPDSNTPQVENTPNVDPNDITAWILEDDTNMSGSVSFWIPFAGDQGMDAMIAAFNEIYPNIDVELMTYNNNAEGNVSVNTAIMAGEVDVLASFEIVNAHSRWSNGLYLDLTDKMSSEGIDLINNWGTNAYSYNDKYFVLPCGGISYYVAINQTAWDEAGLGAIPTSWTWDEYLEVCEKLTKRDAAGNVTTAGGSNYHIIGDILDVIYQVDGKDRYYNDDGTSSFNSELVVNTVKRNIEAENSGIWFPLTTYRADNQKAWFAYMDESIASTVIPNITRFIRNTEEYPLDFITTFAPYPTEEAGQTNYMSGVNYFSFAGIAQNCKDEPAAWAFLKWYSTYGSRYLVIAGHQSTWKGTNTDDVITLMFESEENASKIIDVEAFKRVVGRTDNPSAIDIQTTAYAELTNIWNEYAIYAYNGEMSVEDALNEAASLANKAING